MEDSLQLMKDHFEKIEKIDDLKIAQVLRKRKKKEKKHEGQRKEGMGCCKTKGSKGREDATNPS